MRTIKTLPTLMLAASLSAGMVLVSEAAFARGNGNNGNNGHHEQHNDHQDRKGMRSGKNDRSGASQPGTLREIRTGNGGADKWRASRRGKSPKDSVIAKKPPTSADGKPSFDVTRGGSPPRGPVAGTNAPPKGLPPGTATVSNGRVKLYIPNSTYGLTVTKNPSGTITVSNGDPTRSVTLPGGSVTVSGGGVTSLGGGAGVQVVRQPNGDFAAAASLPPAPTPKPAPSKPGTVTGGPEGGFFHALGSGLNEWIEPGFSSTKP
ncbi:MAG TPA: hypothetical protein VKB08_03665 [Bradyrhizobium sp.]|nr:hypothetical protein [Bradyrhizobium sp.]